MIFTTYLLYKLYADKCYKEGFEGTQQSLGGVDDTNAINTLAQIAKNLMAGGVTVPGAMNVTGGVTTPKGTGFKVTSSSGQSYGIWGGGGSGFASDNGLEIHTYNPNGSWAGNPLNIIGNDTRINGNQSVAANQSVAGNLTIGNGSIATGGAPGQSKGTIISNMGDSWGMLWGSECALIGQKGKPMRFGFADAYNAAGWDEKMRIQPDGTFIVQGRNILAELNNLNAKTANLNLGKFRLTDEGVALTIRNSQRGDDTRFAFFHDHGGNF